MRATRLKTRFVLAVARLHRLPLLLLQVLLPLACLQRRAWPRHRAGDIPLHRPADIHHTMEGTDGGGGLGSFGELLVRPLRLRGLEVGRVLLALALEKESTSD